jgi:hypothetical protein
METKKRQVADLSPQWLKMPFVTGQGAVTLCPWPSQRVANSDHREEIPLFSPCSTSQCFVPHNADPVNRESP